MSLKERLKEKALELGFEDVGFTTVEPLDLYIKEIESRPEMYQWTMTESFNPLRGATPTEKYPWAKSIMVLIQSYYRRAFPPQLAGAIGRCYQVDERIEPGEDNKRIRAYFDFLKAEGVNFYMDGEIPARMSAARAGVTTYGKNCFAYARRAVRGSSWITSLPMVIDAEIEPDEPSIELGCPSWCKNACIAACPTGAIYAPKKMNPSRCIAFNSYNGEGITAMDLREPMGIWIYGCDRCQEVCPRNQPWLNQDLPENRPLMDRAKDFDFVTLLSMTQEHYEKKVWPLCFYISRKNTAKWQMNAARAIGNRGDREDVPVLVDALAENPHEMSGEWPHGPWGKSAENVPGKHWKPDYPRKKDSQNRRSIWHSKGNKPGLSRFTTAKSVTSREVLVVLPSSSLAWREGPREGESLRLPRVFMNHCDRRSLGPPFPTRTAPLMIGLLGLRVLAGA